jgi:hypothetical protein
MMVRMRLPCVEFGVSTVISSVYLNSLRLSEMTAALLIMDITWNLD